MEKKENWKKWLVHVVIHVACELYVHFSAAEHQAINVKKNVFACMKVKKRDYKTK